MVIHLLQPYVFLTQTHLFLLRYHQSMLQTFIICSQLGVGQHQLSGSGLQPYQKRFQLRVHCATFY